MWQFSHLFKIIIRAIAKQFTFFFALDYYFSLNRTVAVATTADISTKFAVHCVRSSMAEDVTGFYACWNAVVHLKNASKNYYAPLERIICIFTVKARKQETNEWEQRRAPTNSFFFFFCQKTHDETVFNSSMSVFKNLHLTSHVMEIVTTSELFKFNTDTLSGLNVYVNGKWWKDMEYMYSRYQLHPYDTRCAFSLPTYFSLPLPPSHSSIPKQLYLSLV